MLARWVTITGALSLRNLVEISSIPEATSLFFKILSTVATSTLCKIKSTHSFQVCLQYSSVVLIRNLLFAHESFCNNESAEFEKICKKYLDYPLN